jgi:hypothetical protein
MKGTVNKDIAFISDSFNKCTQRRPYQLQLLFRASQHAFKAEAFHQVCDNVNETFLLIRTEAGRTIAGYSHYKWGIKEDIGVKVKLGNVTYVRDSERRAFLLQLDKKQCLKPTVDDCLVVCRNEYGPVFGVVLISRLAMTAAVG